MVYENLGALHYFGGLEEKSTTFHLCCPDTDNETIEWVKAEYGEVPEYAGKLNYILSRD